MTFKDSWSCAWRTCLWTCTTQRSNLFMKTYTLK